jgi:hypothetical protein
LVIQVPTTGKDNIKAPDCKVAIPYIPKEEKYLDASDSKPPSVKLILHAKGDAIYNPTVQVQQIFNGGTMEQFFKWYKSLISLVEVQSVGEYYRLALKALWGTNKAL